MELSSILIISFVLDTVFGDPKSLPHLIVWYGNLISFLEKKLNRGQQKIIKGTLLVCICLLVVVLSTQVLFYICGHNYWVKILISSVLMFYCLANKTLVDEGKAVFNELKNKGLQAGRKRLSWIVGRDTTNLTDQQIKKATLETMSENLSDGVIAPLFYFLLFGVLGALVYKMINTLDSMIGYKNERYEKFGKFAAKLDDVANYIPARLTAVLMLIVTLNLKGLKFVFTEGKNHSSPNAGYPEAALAFILSCRFGGPNVYFGKLVDKPFIGYDKRAIAFSEINKVASINYKSSVFFIVIAVVLLSLNEFL